MRKELLERYAVLVAFLGGVLGPDFEITLYDLEAGEQALAAIANGQINRRSVGNLLPEIASGLPAADGRDYILNFTSRLDESGKVIRSSALLLRDEDGKPAGLLVINFDDSRYLSFCSELFDLIHPDSFVQKQYVDSQAYLSDVLPISIVQEHEEKTVHNDIGTLIAEIFSETVRTCPLPVDRLTQNERIALIAQLKARGMFRMKGAIAYAAEHLGCSQASIYRYLGKLKHGAEA